MSDSYRLLRIALVVFGVLMLLLYPIAVVWPSGWAWHHGAPHESQYFMMIVGVYATLGVFLIWFTVWSSVVDAAIMAVQSFGHGHMGHLWADVPALLLIAVVLAVLVKSSGVEKELAHDGRIDR
jgi:hypothetical protein